MNSTTAAMCARLAEPGGVGITMLGYRRSKLAILLSLTFLALANNLLRGMDLSSDTLNYHVYAGFSALHDRFSMDYFAAGPQAYQNPYIYAPFYALVQTQLPALVVSSLLGLVHCLILWMSFELAVCVCPTEDLRTRMAYGSCAAALALLNPILLQQVGSSYADITTAELALGGWLLLAGAAKRPGNGRVVFAGILLGVATAFKLTNAVHALAGTVILAAAPVPWKSRARSVGYYFVAGLLAGAVVAAPWAYQLYRNFGNPFFPLMNGLFRSPEYTTEPILHHRFIPWSWAEAFWRPFTIMKPMYLVQEELRAPDLRYAILVLLAVVAVLTAVWKRWRFAAKDSVRAVSGMDPSKRVLMALGGAFAVDWAIWLKGSGNGRYFLPMASVAAVLVVAMVFRILVARPKMRDYALSALFAAQLAQLAYGTDFRWDPYVGWKGPWLSIDVPPALAEQPNLFLTIGVESNSFLAPYLAKGSGLINVSGQLSFGQFGANGQRTLALINRYSPHLRVLLENGRPWDFPGWLRDNRDRTDDVLARFGLHLDDTDCNNIVASHLPLMMQNVRTRDGTVAELTREAKSFATCRVVPGAETRNRQQYLKSLDDLAFDRIEDACPQLFQPRRPYTEMIGGTGSRRYPNTDIVAWVREDTIRFFSPITGDPIYEIGAAHSVADRSLRLECGRSRGHYFAHLVNARGGP